MSTFSLSQTGTEINSAIGKVHNADTTPIQGSANMVTSGGIYTAVNNIGASSLPTTTEAQGIANNDNDDKIPTNAAVIDYVASASAQTILSRSSQFQSSSESWQDIPNVSISGVNPQVVWNGTNFVISPGVYYYYAVAELANLFRIRAINITEFDEYSLVDAEAGAPSINKEISSGSAYRQTTGLCYFPTATTLRLQVKKLNSFAVDVNIRNMEVHFVKLSAV